MMPRVLALADDLFSSTDEEDGLGVLKRDSPIAA